VLLRPTYRIEISPSGACVATVRLPAASPVPGARGRPAAGARRRAKASAALAACAALHAAGALDDHLLPAELDAPDSREDLDESRADHEEGQEEGEEAAGRVRAMTSSPRAPAFLGQEIRVGQQQQREGRGGCAVLQLYTCQPCDDEATAGCRTVGLLLGGELPTGLGAGAVAHGGARQVRGAQLPALLACSAALRRQAGDWRAASGGEAERGIEIEDGGEAKPTTFALVPLRAGTSALGGGAAGSGSGGGWAIDWGAVEETAGLAAAEAAGDSALELLARFGGGAALAGRVVATRYNKQQYVIR
jgi:hypothetical protein